MQTNGKTLIATQWKLKERIERPTQISVPTLGFVVHRRAFNIKPVTISKRRAETIPATVSRQHFFYGQEQEVCILECTREMINDARLIDRKTNEKSAFIHTWESFKAFVDKQTGEKIDRLRSFKARHNTSEAKEQRDSWRIGFRGGGVSIYVNIRVLQWTQQIDKQGGRTQRK